ncbi:uncharacterized protein LOC124113132 [Haliotis rufescens]|uniref:uncharacterized protein LOC124113132 n=1 Tax=Haliotis rufescens TaxID=6454 RepID=UPI00201EF437|nr:uncharacterized protein LOC124113132 [Haliotis rufescens]XP_048253763.1 uncharacterized protein LOC124113132 [Haliotis rufescens]
MENLKKHLFPSSRPAVGSETRSVFHIDNGSNDHLSKEVQECFESVEEFKNAVKNLDGAGTHLTESLTKALKETQHQSIAEDCGVAFREVYACDQTAFVSRQLQDMSSALYDLKAKMDDATADNMAAEYAQTLCKVLLVFLKTQQTYHKLCSDRMMDLVQKLNMSKGIQNQGEITEHFLALLTTTVDKSQNKIHLKNGSSPSQSPKGSPKTKKAVKGPDSPKPLAKQTFKSSLLSLFDRKPSPEEGKSAFYVDMGSDAAGCSTTNELDSTQTAGSSELLQRRQDQAGAHTEQISASKEVPQANLLGLDLDGPAQGHRKLEASAQGHPRLDNTSLGLSKLALMGQGQIPNTIGQGHLPSATGQGQPLVELIGLPESCDPKLAAGSLLKPHLMGLDPAHPSHMNPVVDPRNLQIHGLQPQPGVGVMQVNCQLASEEELESVINLLSGVNCSNSPMQAIPENQVQGQVQLTVPQIYRMPSPASDSNVEEMKHPKYQMHRRSEGCLDLSGVRGNTWPHQHRASLPAVQSFPQRPMMDPSRDATMYMRQCAQEMHMPYRPNPAYIATGPGPGPIMSTSQWSFPGSGTWPAMHTHGGSDTMNSSWSGVQDSSDLSDDSSSGEQFYAVGRDLVQAIDSKEDSSDEDCDRRRGPPNYQGAVAADPHDVSSMHTWPPKQQWSHSNLYLSSGVEHLEPPDNSQFQHRPVQMQWSDPMSSRSMWPAGPPPLGIPPQRTSQSMQGFGTLQ